MTDDSIVEVAPTILTREYKAPRQLVFEAWTQVEHLKNWMFPFPGFQCEYAYAEIKSGGSSLHKMIAPNGFEMWLLSKYEAVEPPEKLVFRQYNSNENGDILPNPQMENWPREMQTTILLEQAGDITKLQLIWQPIDATQIEADTFDSTRADHEKGWGGGLEQLGVYLSQ